MKINAIRVWKDATYRESLSEEQLNQTPANPAGELELSDAELEAVYGGWGGFGFDHDHEEHEFRLHVNTFSLTAVRHVSFFSLFDDNTVICGNNFDFDN